MEGGDGKQAAAQKAWNDALKALEEVRRQLSVFDPVTHLWLEEVAARIKKLGQDVLNMESCGAEEFERHREEMDKAEAESRTVKEKLRDATKAFKAASLPTPPKADRQIVEKRYTEIKEDLAKAKLDWREALARSRVHEANKLMQSRRNDLSALVDSLVAAEKMPFEEFEAHRRQGLLKFEELEASLGFSAKSAKELGIDKRADCEAFAAAEKQRLEEHFAGRAEEYKTQNEQARRLADLLSAYAKWTQEKLAELRTPNFSREEKMMELQKRLEGLLKESEERMAAIQALPLKTPNLDPVHHELIVAVQQYKEQLRANKRNSNRILKLKRDSGLLAGGDASFVQEPKFASEPSFNRYRERISKGQFVWTEEEIQTLLAEGGMPDVKGLSVSEFEVLTKDLAIGVVKGYPQRDSESNDALFLLANQMFEKAIFNNPRSTDLKFNGASNILNWASLRCKMDHLIYKGQAIFPILEKALVWLESASTDPHADQGKIVDRVAAIEALRKRTKNLDDSTSSRMKQVLVKQAKELDELEKLAEKLLKN